MRDSHDATRTTFRPERLAAMGHEEFKIGDRVRVKGVYGPDMTVQEVYAPVFRYRYRCMWQDGQGMPAHELFRPEQLERVPAPACRSAGLGRPSPIQD
jgi:uncharacterized protein YodC (DUF2158 family)